MRRDFSLVTTCEGIVFLPGWENSEGARAERVVGFYSGLVLFDFDITGITPAVDAVPKITFSTDDATLWDALPGIKSIRLSLIRAKAETIRTGAGGEMTGTSSAIADIHVDIVDSVDGALRYDFGELRTKVGTQQLIKLDATVREVPSDV